VHNARFAEDTNILSTALGVDALRAPGAGYAIIETDVVIAPAGWSRVLEVARPERSFWVTAGRDGPDLTGGALRVGPEGNVEGLVYAPVFEERYRGYAKLLGIAYVGQNQVEADRRLRASAMARSIAQYYMTPWMTNLSVLACEARDLSDVFTGSYN